MDFIYQNYFHPCTIKKTYPKQDVTQEPNRAFTLVIGQENQERKLRMEWARTIGRFLARKASRIPKFNSSFKTFLRMGLLDAQFSDSGHNPATRPALNPVVFMAVIKDYRLETHNKALMLQWIMKVMSSAQKGNNTEVTDVKLNALQG